MTVKAHDQIWLPGCVPATKTDELHLEAH
jgi:hypothetical protein